MAIVVRMVGLLSALLVASPAAPLLLAVVLPVLVSPENKKSQVANKGQRGSFYGT